MALSSPTRSGEQMRLHVRIVSLEELASPLIGPPVMWEGDFDYDGPAHDAAICEWLFQRLNRYTGDARERLSSVGYYHAPAVAGGDLIAFANAAVPPIDREVKLYRVEDGGRFVRLR